MAGNTAVLSFAAVLLASQARAQTESCAGLNIADPGPAATVVSLEVARESSGGWRLVHARLNRVGADRASAVILQDGALTVTIDQLQSAYSGTLSPNGRVIRGSWTTHGRTVPLTLRCSIAAGAAPDSSPHGVRFIEVEKDVRLEVLDWGGTGRSVVLLHGMGRTGHDFDAFASRLTPYYRVFAITRRGSGGSGAPDAGYASDRLGDDVLAVLDSLGLRDPVLVGHSFGGAQLSSVGSRFPRRVAGLVYLDAANSYAYVDPAREDPFGLGKDGGWLCPCTLVERLNMGMRAYRTILVPALAIFAMNANWDADGGVGWSNAVQASEFERGVPAARVVRVSNADHYVFRSHEADVLREMRAFIDALPAVRR